MSAIDRLRAIASRDPDDRMARDLLDVVETAAKLYVILQENGMGVGLLKHPPYAAVYSALGEALSRAENGQTRPE